MIKAIWVLLIVCKGVNHSVSMFISILPDDDGIVNIDYWRWLFSVLSLASGSSTSYSSKMMRFH